MLPQFLDILVQNTGVDFHHYKPTTLQRRITRRMHMLNISSEKDYLSYLQNNDHEQHLLYKEMLIHVTSFFRDETSFDYLCSRIIPDILAKKSPNDIVRIWVCGCATGEEAYSIAICFHEHLAAYGDLAKIKIFASDLSESAIAKARIATYSQSAIAKISEKRLETYFEETEKGWRVKSFIRDMCVFAVHNVLTHPPFANVDLLSCRNVLIYMKPVLQRKMLATFSYSLREKGYLFLGKSETSGLAGKFDPINLSANIFTNRERYARLSSAGSKLNIKIEDMTTPDRTYQPDKPDFQKAADDLLLSKYIPASVVVSDTFEIVDFRGNTGFYVDPSPGIASFNVLKMIRKGLYYDLQEALNTAKTEKITVKRENVAIENDGMLMRINIEVQPLNGTRDKYYLVLFKDMTVPTPIDGGDDGINSTRDLRIHRLEQELMQSREQLRALSEEQEATNEEFQSANEELKTLNEELQTYQEELISTNEELTVRNKELNALNREIESAQLFAESINDTINDALLVLDPALRVKSANKTFYKMFGTSKKETENHLIYDVGNRQWNIPGLRHLLETILPDKTEMSDFVVTHTFDKIGQRTVSLNAKQLLVSREAEPMILLVIKDITNQKQLEFDLEQAANRLVFAMTTGSLGTWTLEKTDNKLHLSDQSLANLGLTNKKQLSYNEFVEMIHPEDRESFLDAIMLSAESNDAFSIEFRVHWPDKSIHWLALTGSTGPSLIGDSSTLTGIITEITARKEDEQRLKYSEHHFKTLSESAPVMIGMSDSKGAFGYFNKRWLTYAGVTEHTAMDWHKDLHPDDESGFSTNFMDALKQQKGFETQFRLRHKGKYRWISCEGIPRFDLNSNFLGFTVACSDIQDQKATHEALEKKVEERTEALRDLNDELINKNRELEQFAYVTSHDLQEPLRKIRVFTSILSGRNQNKDTQSYLEKIESSASKMIHLIQDLLNYSSLKEKEREFVPVDLNKTLNMVLQDFDLSIHEKNALITIGNLPVIDAVPIQMTQLFYNLVSNSLKFVNPGKKPEIKICSDLLSPQESAALGMADSGPLVRLQITDNGIGFDNAHAAHVFEIFQRFHSEDEYKGNGIGLALCKKITEAHQGRISVKSQPGKGTEFTIILPEKQKIRPVTDKLVN